MTNKPGASEGGAQIDLPSLEREVREERAYAKNGHAARTLIRLPDLRVVLLVMKSGSHIPEHVAHETATLQVLSGQMRVGLPDRAVDLAQGQLFILPSGLRHDVRATTDNAILLTLGWPGEQQ